MKSPKSVPLTAIRTHRYGTRHLTAGEEYEAPKREAVAHVAARKARFAHKVRRKVEAKMAEESPAAEAVVDVHQMQPEPTHSNNIEGLRETAARLGFVVDGRWGVARLQHEIARHRR